MLLLKLSISLCLLNLVERGESKAVNQTMRYFVLPMSDWEAEAVSRQPRQENSNASNLAPAGTASNVINILTGLYREDVRPIVSGGTAFIPPGGLRESVTVLLQELAPALQRILFGDRSNLPTTDYTIATAAPVPRTEPPTSPRPRIRRTTTLAPETTSVTTEENSEEETEAPLSQTSTSPLPTLPTSTSSSVQSTAAVSSVESDEETEAPAPAATTGSHSPTSAPAQVGIAFTEKVDSAIPESPLANPEQVARPPSSQPQAAPPQTPSPFSPSASNATQLKVILEDSSSIVTANVVNNPSGEDKKYIYLVLLPEQYEEYDKLTSMKQRQEEETKSEVVSAIQPQTQLVETPTTNSAVSTLEIATSPPKTTVRSKNRNRNRTTTIAPLHLQLQYYYQLTSTTELTTTTTTTTPKTSTTDLPGVQGFEEDDDELEN